MPIDLCKDEDVADLLQGNSALLEAAKKGNLAKVKKLLTPENINCRDTHGRNSTALHLAAGLHTMHNYNETFVKSIVKLKEKIINFIDLLLVSFVIGYNNLEVAEYLLEKGADVNSRDKGGLIPLHNA